jgi:hypothetical protein
VHERLGWRALSWWTIAFCVHRAAILWWGFDGHFFWEETYRLVAAEALWDGWPWPLLDLQADPYAGGSLVFSLLAAPVVALTGPSLVALKLIALAWSAMGFVAWTHLIDHYWGRRPAHLFAFLFVLAPPLFALFNLIAMGSHAEVMTLAGIQLLLAYRVLYGRNRSAITLMAWGAIAGFGTWFTYDSALPLLVCVGVGIASGALPVRSWPALLGGFLVGFSPWVATNLASGGRGLDVVARTFHLDGSGGRSIAGVVESVRYLLQTGIPLGLRYADVFAALTGSAPRRLLLPHLYLAVYAASVAIVAWSCARRSPSGATARSSRLAAPELPLLLLFPALILILAVSDQVFLEHERVPFFSFRLLVPFLPAVMAVIALGTVRLPPAIRWPTMLILALIGLAGTTSLLHAGATQRTRHVAEARMLGAEAAGHLLYYKHPGDMHLLAERIAVMPEELQGPAWRGVGYSIAYHFPDDRAPDELTRTLTEAPPRFLADLADGARLALGPGMEQVKPRPLSPSTHELAAAVDSLGRPALGP